MTRQLLRQERTGNRQVDNLGRNVELFARLARQSPFWSGKLVSGVTLNSTGTTQVNHQLGYAYSGWLVVRQVGNAVVFEPPGVATQASAAASCPLQASGPCTVSLWFY